MVTIAILESVYYTGILIPQVVALGTYGLNFCATFPLTLTQKQLQVAYSL